MQKDRRNSRILPSLAEKRYYTLNFLESAVMGGSPVDITTVVDKEITDLSGEKFTYSDEKISTYVIFDERPKVNLLKTYGWYREDGPVPIIAYIPTHLLYNKTGGDATVFKDFYSGRVPDSSNSYVNLPIVIKKGTVIKLQDSMFSGYTSSLRNSFYEEAAGAGTPTNPIISTFNRRINFNFLEGSYSLSLSKFVNGAWVDALPSETAPFENSFVKWDPSTLELTYKGTGNMTINYCSKESTSYPYFDENHVQTYINTTSNDLRTPNGLLSQVTQDIKVPAVTNYDVLSGKELKDLVKEGESENFILSPLKIIRGTLVDIKYDFLPKMPDGSDDPMGVTNRFFVADSKVDLVSMNYIASLMPYRYDIPKPTEEENEDINSQYIDFDTSKFGL